MSIGALKNWMFLIQFLLLFDNILFISQTVLWFLKQYHYSRYTIQIAILLIGSVGDPVVQLSNVTNSTAILSWNTSSSSGDFPVVGYNISLTDDVDGSFVFETTDRQKKTFDDLLQFRNYTFAIYAFNRFKIMSTIIKQSFTTAGLQPYNCFSKSLFIRF